MTNYANWHSTWSPRFCPIWAHWHTVEGALWNGTFVCGFFSILAQLLTCKTSEARWRLLYGIKTNVKDCKTGAYSDASKTQRTSNAAFSDEDKTLPGYTRHMFRPKYCSISRWMTLQQILPFCKSEARINVCEVLVKSSNISMQIFSLHLFTYTKTISIC